MGTSRSMSEMNQPHVSQKSLELHEIALKSRRSLHCPLKSKGLSGQHDGLQIPENSKEEHEIPEGIRRF